MKKDDIILPQRITIKVKDKNGVEYETAADIIPMIMKKDFISKK